MADPGAGLNSRLRHVQPSLADEQNDAPAAEVADLYILSVDTDTLRHLIDATEALKRAVVASSCGAVEDHCQTAMQAIRQAMRSAGA